MRRYSVLGLIAWFIGMVYSHLLLAGPMPGTPANSIADAVTVKIISGWTEPDGGWCVGFVGDKLTLVVSKNGKRFETQEFCSSYGKASATVVVDAKGSYYILLEFGVGQGTGIPDVFLDVFRLQKDMVECARIPLAQQAGPASSWMYDYTIRAPRSGGLFLTLHRKMEGSGPVPVTLPEKTRTLGINTVNSDGPIVYTSGMHIF